MFKKTIPILKKGTKFIVTAHEHADGDALGSQVGLYYLLKQMGKTVRAINCDEPQRKLRFIDPEGVVETYRAGSGPVEFEGTDAWIIVDTSAIARIGTMGELVPCCHCTKIVLDHHVFVPEEAFADINIVDDTLIATAMLVYRLGRELKLRLDPLIATALYTAIYTDSGGFIYSKVNPETLEIAADLMRAGAVPVEIHDRLYQVHTACEAKLLGRALNSLQFERNGRIAWMTISGRMYRNCGADPEGSELYLLNYVRAIKDVELVVLLRQMPEGKVKVSLRSRRFLRVNGIARALGGGGHWFAAGAIVAGHLNAVRRWVSKLIAREWRAASRNELYRKKGVLP